MKLKRCEIAFRAWVAEEKVMGQAWQYLPPQMMETYIRAFYRGKLLEALVLEDSEEKLAELLVELLELAP